MAWVIESEIIQKLYWELPEGKQKLLWVSGGFELSRVQVMESNMYDRNPEETDFGSSEHKVPLSEGSSSRDSTAF